jgi:hypothetical protein
MPRLSEQECERGMVWSEHYDECMLDKMKGQPWNMGEIVAKACMIQFACNDNAKAEFIKCMHDSPNFGTHSCGEIASVYCHP